MKGFKGFDKNLKCRDKQYEIGQTYEEDEISLCKKGLHFCEHPLGCFGYYPPAGNRFAEIEAEDVSDEKQEDSKRVAKKITIKSELSLRGLIEAAVEFTFDKAVWTGHDKSTGYQGAASATGKNSIALASGIEGKASGALGCWIVLAEWERDENDEWDIKEVKSVQVDGKKIKPDTFYTLQNGEFVEDKTE
jgi:hypothetical protein